MEKRGKGASGRGHSTSESVEVGRWDIGEGGRIEIQKLIWRDVCGRLA